MNVMQSVTNIHITFSLRFNLNIAGVTVQVTVLLILDTVVTELKSDNFASGKNFVLLI